MRRFSLFLALLCHAIASPLLGADATAVKISQAATHLDVTLGGEAFTTYWFGQRDDRPYVRPFFWPVLATGQVGVTSDQFSLKKTDPKADHPHHQSLWVAHGDVNGLDHWTFGKNGSGEHVPRQQHLGFDSVTDDSFVERLAWNDLAGKPVLNETRTVRFFAYPDGARAIDVTSALTPAAGPVTLGDTKEAGMLAVRLAPQIAAHPTLTQSTGKGGAGMAGEKETWGKAADWCDESGQIDGKPFGVAVLDFPTNPRHPATWHVRAYGLLASNIFGLSEFDKKKYARHSGDLVIEPGKTITFRHLAVIHPGAAADAKLAEKYAGWCFTQTN